MHLETFAMSDGTTDVEVVHDGGIHRFSEAAACRALLAHHDLLMAISALLDPNFPEEQAVTQAEVALAKATTKE